MAIKEGIVGTIWRHVVRPIWSHVVPGPQPSPGPEDFLELETGFLLEQEDDFNFVLNRI
jgi:hypothetical protein